MRLSRSVLALAAVAAVAVGVAVAMPRSKPPLVTIDQLIAHHAAFDRKEVRVRGYLSQCGAENCVLTSAPIRSGNFFAWHKQGGRMLSIGRDDHFDQQTSGFDSRAVVIRARFRDDCLRPGLFCVDRAPTLQPSGWHSILPAEEI